MSLAEEWRREGEMLNGILLLRFSVPRRTFIFYLIISVIRIYFIFDVYQCGGMSLASEDLLIN